MKLPVLQTFRVEDYPEQKGWIEKLTSPLNSFLSTMVLCMRNGLTFSENFNATVKTLEVIGGTYPVIASHTIKSQPIGVLILQAFEKNDPTATIGTGINLEWMNDSATSVKIKNFTGLTTGTRYTIRILIIGG